MCIPWLVGEWLLEVASWNWSESRYRCCTENLPVIALVTSSFTVAHICQLLPEPNCEQWKAKRKQRPFSHRVKVAPFQMYWWRKVNVLWPGNMLAIKAITRRFLVHAPSLPLCLRSIWTIVPVRDYKFFPSDLMLPRDCQPVLCDWGLKWSFYRFSSLALIPPNTAELQLKEYSCNFLTSHSNTLI